MATIGERLALVISADVDDAVRGLNKLDREAGKSIGSASSKADMLGDRLTKVGAGMMAAGTLGIVGLGRAAQATSNLNEAVSLTEAIFGDASDEIGDFSAGASTSIGQSERAAREATASFGGLLQNMGLAQDETVKWSQDLTVLASDLGSAFNRDPEDAVLALGAALRGESEPIRRYNVMLDKATIKAKAVELGLADTTAEVDKAAEAQATLALIMEQTNAVQGNFAETSDGLANRQRTFNAQLEDFQAALGQGLLPVMEELLGAGSGLLEWFNGLDEGTQKLISTMAAATAGLALLGGGLSMVVGQIIKARTNFAAMGRMMSGRFAVAVGVATVAMAAYVIQQKRAADEAQRHAEIQGVFATALGAAAGPLDAAMRGIKEMATEGNLLDRSMEEAGVSVGDMALAFVEGDEAIEEMAERLRLATLMMGGSHAEAEAVRDMVLEMGGGFQDANEATEEMNRLMDAGASKSVPAMELAMRGLTGATNDVEDAADDTKQAWSELLREFRTDIEADELLADVWTALNDVNDMSLLEARQEVDRLLGVYEGIAEQAAENGEVIPEEARIAAEGFVPLLEAAGATAGQMFAVQQILDGINGQHYSATFEVVDISQPWTPESRGLVPASGPTSPPTYGGMTESEWQALSSGPPTRLTLQNDIYIDGTRVAQSTREADLRSGGQITGG